ncbi:pentapeptide repeat-containing protein, partial [Mycobacterium persicum]|uniref:pentapeptide repeat-containing protein n=1 Tax=Mycobacterium persicum TaxID=1487726 RepID=UPI001594C12A
GNMDNGWWWRGDSQGLIGAYYAITVPEIPAFFNVAIPVDIPITISITDIEINPVTIPKISFSGLDDGIGGKVIGSIGPASVYGAQTGDPIVISFGEQPAVAINVGNPDGSTVINISGTGGLGPISIPIVDVPAAPGFGTATTSPSSGFFNAGAGSASGFANFGANNSGLWNVSNAVAGNSGYLNYGSLQSGLANFGNTISGLYNTGTVGLTSPANVSGIASIGTDLAGVLRDGPTATAFNAGLANIGAGNVGFANIGDVNLGSANIGDFNLGSGNIGDLNVGSGNLGGTNLGSGNIGNGNIGF